MDTLTEGEVGQSVALNDWLRSHLREYAGGIGIAKELLQNADDAGAMRIRFALDLREHAREKLPDPRMGPLLGPALLVTSDQVFSDHDLTAITEISLGAKRDRPGKAGRFGEGFNACYHVTDYPCFATREWIYCFDPMRDAVASPGATPGRWWSLQSAWERFPDWPRAFDVPEGQSTLMQTTFRFPLRPTALARPDRLSRRPFLEADARNLFAELEKWGGAFLLFLHRVLHLEVDVLRPDGVVEHRLRVTTQEPEALTRERERLLETDEKKLKGWLRAWHAGQAQTLEGQYEHRFTIEAPGARREERFLVTKALDAEGQPLLDAARNMEAIGDRAKPWAGAALPLSPGMAQVLEPRVADRLFCTLPLVQGAKLAFFLDGAFDVVGSRTGLRYGARDGDEGVVRSTWNRALLTEVAPRAIVALLRAARSLMGEGDPNAFYALWPGAQDAGPMTDLVRAVYARLAREPLLRMRSGDQVQWVMPAQAHAPGDWSAELRRALLADGLFMLDPRPPPAVMEGLASVRLAPKAWTAEAMRTWLRMDGDLGCALSKAPRRSLRSRALVIELFKKYGTGQKGACSGLPLALMADGTLRVFDRGATLYIAAPELQGLLPRSRHDFLDAEFVNQAGVKPDDAANVRNAGISTLLEALPGYLQPPLDQAWLIQVLRYLEKFDLKKFRPQFRALPLLQDQHGKLHRADVVVLPLHVHQGARERLREALLQLDVPVLTADPELVALLRVTSLKLVESETDLLPPLTGEAVALALTPAGVAAAKPAMRALLLDWLSDEHKRTALSERALTHLKPLKLWKDEEGVLAAAVEQDLFVPTQYQPPPHLPRYRLLERRWWPLLRALGIQELNRSRVIEAVIRDIEQAPEGDERVLKGLRWLREEADRDQLMKEEGKERADEVLALLRSRPIVPGAGGQRIALNALYHPDAEDALEVLGSRAPQLAPELLQDKRERLRWLEWMQLNRLIRASDLLARIDDLVKEALLDCAASVAEPLLRVLRFLGDDAQWKRLERLGPELSLRTWLPAISGGDGPVQAAGFEPARDGLYKPGEVYPEAFQHLMATQAPLVRIDPYRAACAGLGIPTEVPLKMAVAHLRTLRERWQQSDHGKVDPESLDEMSRRFFQRLGSPPDEAFAEEEQALVEAVATEPCIWHAPTRQFWRPAHVFLQRVPGMERLRVHLEVTDAEKPGLERLGVHDVPRAEDYLSFLRELADRYRGKVLPDDLKQSVRWAWFHLAEEDEGEWQGAPPVLTRDGMLLEPGLVLEDDAPWWSTRLREAGIPLLAEIDATAARKAGVRRASDAVKEVALDTGSDPHPDVAILVEQLQQYLGEPELHGGFLRIVMDARDSSVQVSDEQLWSDIDEALRLHVEPASSLRTGLTCPQLGRHAPFGAGEAESLLVGDRLLLAIANREVAAHEVAMALTRRLPPGLQPKDLSALEAILRCPPSAIDEVLNRRRIRARSMAVEAPELSDLDPVPAAEIFPEEVPFEEGQPPEPIEDEMPVTEYVQSQARSGGGAVPLGGFAIGPARWVGSSGLTPAPGGPPITPGDGTSRGPAEQGRSQLRSYAFPLAGAPRPPRRSPEDLAALKRAAVEYVLETARADGGQAEDLGEAFPGYRVRIQVSDEEGPRHVVVAALFDAWDRAGFRLTRAELREAQEQREHFWVYVVEHTLQPERRTLTKLQDPWGKVDEFRFDSGWRDVAEGTPQDIPAAGLGLFKGEELLGIIEEVTSLGQLYLLLVRAPDGQTRMITFSRSTHRLAAPVHDGPNDP